MQKAIAGTRRAGRLLATVPTIVDGPGTPLPPGPLAVDIDGARLEYATGHVALDGVDLHLAPGTVLGVVGRTGSGKTSLGRLLARLWDPAAGTVRLGGVDLRDTTDDELRRRVAVVSQDVELFDASLRDNLTLYGTRPAPDDRPGGGARHGRARPVAGGPPRRPRHPARRPQPVGRRGPAAGVRPGAARPTPGWSCSTRPPAGSTRSPRPGWPPPPSRCWPGGRPSSSPTAWRPSTGSTRCASSTTAVIVEHGRRATLAADPGSRFAALLRGGEAHRPSPTPHEPSPEPPGRGEALVTTGGRGPGRRARAGCGMTATEAPTAAPTTPTRQDGTEARRMALRIVRREPVAYFALLAQVGDVPHAADRSAGSPCARCSTGSPPRTATACGWRSPPSPASSWAAGRCSSSTSCSGTAAWAFWAQPAPGQPPPLAGQARGPVAGRLPGSSGEAVSRFRDDTQFNVGHGARRVGRHLRHRRRCPARPGPMVEVDARITLAVTLPVLVALGSLPLARPPPAGVAPARTRGHGGGDRVHRRRLRRHRHRQARRSPGRRWPARFEELGDERAEAARVDQVATQVLQTLSAAVGDLGTGLVLLLLVPALARGDASVGDVGLYATAVVAVVVAAPVGGPLQRHPAPGRRLGRAPRRAAARRAARGRRRRRRPCRCGAARAIPGHARRRRRGTTAGAARGPGPVGGLPRGARRPGGPAPMPRPTCSTLRDGSAGSGTATTPATPCAAPSTSTAPSTRPSPRPTHPATDNGPGSAPAHDSGTGARARRAPTAGGSTASTWSSSGAR